MSNQGKPSNDGAIDHRYNDENHLMIYLEILHAEFSVTSSFRAKSSQNPSDHRIHQSTITHHLIVTK
jgi:hypothetical protein